MNDIYRRADVLLLTSSFEGLPVVIMQMMAYGKLVISTAVSGIPDYIFHQQNGLLLYAKEEEGIIAEGIQQIEWLLNEPAKRAALGIQARKDAISQFSRQSFERNYRRILCI